MHYLNRLKAEKKINRVLRVWRNRDRWVYRDDPEQETRERQMLLKTRSYCSCYMCGNMRKKYGRTYKEKASDLLLSETE